MGEEKLHTGETKKEKITCEKNKERPCDVLFLVAYIGIHTILRPIHSQKMFICEVTVEIVSDYIKNNYFMAIAIGILTTIMKSAVNFLLSCRPLVL